MTNMDWQLYAKCASLSLTDSDDLFFVDRGGKINRAQAYCADCPVKESCMMFSLTEPGITGFWAGMDDEDRVQVRKLLSLSAVSDEANAVILELVIDAPTGEVPLEDLLFAKGSTYRWNDNDPSPDELPSEEEVAALLRDSA
jgi:Transcription factor WhiB